jgi:hypothetical protein
MLCQAGFATEVRLMALLKSDTLDRFDFTRAAQNPADADVAAFEAVAVDDAGRPANRNRAV